MPLHKSVFYRGLKHELFAAAQSEDDVDDTELLKKKLKDVTAVWSAPRGSRDFSVCVLPEHPEDGITVPFKRGKFPQHMAVNLGARVLTDPELASILAETGRAAPFHGPDADEPASLLDLHHVMRGAGCPVLYSGPFSNLFKSGFTVRRCAGNFRVKGFEGEAASVAKTELDYEDVWAGTPWGARGSAPHDAIDRVPRLRKRKQEESGTKREAKKAKKGSKEDAPPLDEKEEEPAPSAPPAALEPLPSFSDALAALAASGQRPAPPPAFTAKERAETGDGFGGGPSVAEKEEGEDEAAAAAGDEQRESAPGPPTNVRRGKVYTRRYVRRAWWTEPEAPPPSTAPPLKLVPEAELIMEAGRTKLPHLRPLARLSQRVSLATLPKQQGTAVFLPNIREGPVAPGDEAPPRDLALIPSPFGYRSSAGQATASPSPAFAAPDLRYEAQKPSSNTSKEGDGLFPLPDFRFCFWGNDRFPSLASILAAHVTNQGGQRLEMSEVAGPWGPGSANPFTPSNPLLTPIPLRHVQVTTGASWFLLNPVVLNTFRS